MLWKYGYCYTHNFLVWILQAAHTDMSKKVVGALPVQIRISCAECSKAGTPTGRVV